MQIQERLSHREEENWLKIRSGLNFIMRQMIFSHSVIRTPSSTLSGLLYIGSSDVFVANRNRLNCIKRFIVIIAYFLSLISNKILLTIYPPQLWEIYLFCIFVYQLNKAMKFKLKLAQFIPSSLLKITMFYGTRTMYIWHTTYNKFVLRNIVVIYNVISHLWVISLADNTILGLISLFPITFTKSYIYSNNNIKF